MYARSRPRPTACSTQSTGDQLDSLTGSFSPTVFMSGQNAISTLLQPPILRTGLQPHTSAPSSSLNKAPTVRDIPPVALTDIQHVEAADFEPYISQISPLYERLRQCRDSGGEELPGRISEYSFDGTGPFRQAAGQSPSTRKGSLASVMSATSVVEDPYGEECDRFSRKGYCGPSPLFIVPDIYFDEEFRLENPRTFDVVTERSEVAPLTSPTRNASNRNAPAPRKALATNAILQEKLSWYMDTAEVHLINSISLASTYFFSALGSLREHHLEAAESVEKIIALRRDLASLDADLLHHTVLQLKRIADGVASCESLVDEGEAEKALAQIDAIELLMAGERDELSGDETLTQFQLRDLRGATALQGVAKDLTILRSRIGKVLGSKFHRLLIGDLRRHVRSVSTEEVLRRWEAASLRTKGGFGREPSNFPAYMGVTDELKTALFPNISGLHRSGYLSTAVQAYRELILQEIRNIVRKPLPSSTEDAESVSSSSTTGGGRGRTSQEKSSALARNLRALGAEDAESLFSTIFIGITETLRRLKNQSNILLDIACAVGNLEFEGRARSPTILSPIGNLDAAGNGSMEVQEEMHIALDLPNLLGKAVDLGHERINKILRTRSEQATGLSVVHFLRYYTLNRFFANECEAISGREGTSLRTIVNGHIQDFIKAHGDKENQILSQGMGVDTCQDKDFNTKNNETLQQILECSTADPPAWTELTRIWAPLPEEKAEEMSDTEHSTAKDKIREATIGKETFLLPYSAILCLKGASHFLHLIGGIPSMTPDIAAALVSYLKLFDSRSHQLILGAGAIRSAGLNNVTAAHLALTSQALSFISTIIPHMREFVRRHAPASAISANLLGEFDNVLHVFQEHQDSIYQSLVERMASRSRVLCKKALETDWGKESAEEVRSYMAELTRDTGRLYKALSKRLPGEVVKRVMVPVFTCYKDHLGIALKEADLETETGRDCMRRDVEYLIEKLDKVEGFGDLATYLLDSIESKDIAVAPPTDLTPAPT